MTTGPESLSDLTHFGTPGQPWMLTLVQREIGGGAVTAADFEQIAAAPGATAIRVSGLDQRTFELFVDRYGAQFRGIYFWKCPRISDLTPLEHLPQLTHVAFYWNQRATRLWDLSATPNLSGLQFEDFTRLRDLDDLAGGAALEELEFGDAIWVTSVFASLEPLRRLPLRRLDLSAKQIVDGRIQPLGALQSLEEINAPLGMFTTEQCAWLRAHLPERAQGRILQPVVHLSEPLVAGSDIDTLVVGKRKPRLNSQTAAARIAKYEDEFRRLVEEFRRYPEREPAPLEAARRKATR